MEYLRPQWWQRFAGSQAAALEWQDLRLLALLAPIVPACWIAVLWWSPETLVSGHDAVLQVFTPLRDLAASGASELRYRPDLMGGVKMADAFGNLTLPYLRASLAIGFSPLAAYNSFIFLYQLAVAFLGIGAVRGLVKAWSGEAPALSGVDCVGAGVLFAFAPVLAWRICYGHVNLLLGALAYYAVFCGIVMAMTRRLTLFAATVVAVALWHALQSTGQQMLIYGAVFGGPLLVALMLHLSAAARGDGRRIALQLTGIGVVSALAALPSIVLMLDHVASSDAARGLHTGSVVYGFAIPTWGDWAASIPWSKDLVQTGQSAQLQHELNYAFGPPLLGLAMMPWRAIRSIGVALLACAAAAILFSTNVAPLSTWLPELIAPLHAFRVPARSLIPFAMVTLILAVAAIVLRFRRGDAARVDAPYRSLLIAVPVAVLLAYGLLPYGIGEALAWTLMLVAVLLATRTRGTSRLTCTILLLPLAGATLAAFKERNLPFTPEAALVMTAERLGREVKAAEPKLGSALTRARLDFEVARMWLNTGYAMKISTLDGYWAPQRRMLMLYLALEESPYDAAQVAFAIRPGGKGYAALRQLYNLCCAVSMASGIPRVESLGRTAGEAWVARRVERVADTPALAAVFRDAGESLSERLHETLWLLESDSLAMQAVAKLGSAVGRCGGARINRIDAPHWSGRITIQVSHGAGCPLVVATNYAETLRAVDQDGRPLLTFPADGPLLGVVLGADSKEVVIRVP